MEEEGTDAAVIESGVANFSASAEEETPFESSSPEEEIRQKKTGLLNHLIPANDGHLNNGLISSKSDNFCNADNDVSEREVMAIIGDSRIKNTIPRAKFAQSRAEDDNSSKTLIGIKRVLVRSSGIVYEDEISSPERSLDLSVTQTLPSSDRKRKLRISKALLESQARGTGLFTSAGHSEAVKAVPPSDSHSVAVRATFRRYIDAASRAKLPPGATLLSKRGVYLMKGSEKPFACAYCGKSCRTRKAVHNHISYMHDEKRYSCTFCGICYSEPSRLASHVRIHMQEKPFTCDQCGKQFRSSSALRVHTATHSKEKLFRCNQCDKSCKTKRSLSQHIRYHKVQQQMKGVICDVCKKSFMAPSTLKHHMLIHTGEKPFKCTLCDKQFRMKIALRSHMDSHSGKKKLAKDPCSICGKTLWASRMHDHMNMHAGVKPFECNVCGKRFPKKPNLEGHMRSHTGEKPYACVGCDKRFALYSNMVTHKAKCSKVSDFQGT